MTILAAELMQNPDMGTDLGNGLHKVRMSIASKGKGKRGGARVITLIATLSKEEKEIGLHFIYDKSERENITDKELQAVLKDNGITEKTNRSCQLRHGRFVYLSSFSPQPHLINMRSHFLISFTDLYLQLLIGLHRCRYIKYPHRYIRSRFTSQSSYFLPVYPYFCILTNLRTEPDTTLLTCFPFVFIR